MGLMHSTNWPAISESAREQVKTSIATRDHGVTTRDRNGCDSRPPRDNSRLDSEPLRLRVKPAPLETSQYNSRPLGCDSRPQVLESRPPCLDWAAHLVIGP